MTPGELRVLDAYRVHFEKFGVAPSYRELQREFGLSSVGRVAEMVNSLVTQGKLRKKAGKARGVELTDYPDLRSVPLDAIKAELARRGVTIGALDRSETRTWSKRQAHCAADGCDIDVQRGHLMCFKHWSVLPRALQTDLFRAHSKRDTALFAELLAKAKDFAAQVRS